MKIEKKSRETDKKDKSENTLTARWREKEERCGKGQIRHSNTGEQTQGERNSDSAKMQRTPQCERKGTRPLC